MIVSDPDPRLHQPCDDVEAFDDELAQLVRELRAAMEWSADRGRPALGLAAPQIGVTRRVFAIRCWPQPFVNPTIVTVSVETDHQLEGCLSLPQETLVPLERPRRLKLTAADMTGQRRTFKLRGRDARCALHEIDHLDGVLITDYLQTRVEASA